MELPDFSLGTWSQIHDLRESAAGGHLRRIVADAAQRVALAAADITDEEEVRELLGAEYDEAVREAGQQLPALVGLGSTAVVEYALNSMGMAPSIQTGISVAVAAAELLRASRQWITLMDWSPEPDRLRPIGLR